MDFIRNDNDLVPLANLRKPHHALPIPKDTARIVRIAQDQDLGPLIEKLLQALEIHPVMPILQDHRIIHGNATGPLDVQFEMVIDRRLDDNLVTRLRESQISLVDPGNDPGRITDPFRIEIETVVITLPESDRIEISLRRMGIA